MEEWVVALIKSLPKRLRSQLVPASHVAQQLIQQWRKEGWGKRPFMPALVDGLSRLAEQPIERTDFQWEKIPEHLKIRFEVVGEEGKSIGASRDLDQLKQQFVTKDTQPRRTEHETKFPWLHRKHQTFPDSTIPRQISVDHHGMTIFRYPALCAADTDATLEWFDDPEIAIQHHRNGVWKLLSIADRKEVKLHLSHLPGISRSLMLLGSVLPKDRMMEGLSWLLITIAYPAPAVEVWSPEEWNKLRSTRLERLGGAADEVARWLPEWAESHHRVSLKLEGTPRPAESVRLAIRNQWMALYAPSFLQVTPWEWLREFPRYLKGIVVRCDKSAGQVPKDQASEAIVQRFWDAWEQRPEEDRRRPIETQWQQFRWAIEELRVSLFAQALGTRIAVSPKRLEKMHQQLLDAR
jgi:ATP-dependent helicase HrpA